MNGGHYSFQDKGATAQRHKAGRIRLAGFSEMVSMLSSSAGKQISAFILHDLSLSGCKFCAFYPFSGFFNSI